MEVWKKRDPSRASHSIVMHSSRNLQIGSPEVYHNSMFASISLSNVNPFCCLRCPRAVFTLWKRLLVSKCLCDRSVSCSCSASVYPYPISLQSFLLQAEESCLISSTLVCKLLPQSHLCCSVHWCVTSFIRWRDQNSVQSSGYEHAADECSVTVSHYCFLLRSLFPS